MTDNTLAAQFHQEMLDGYQTLVRMDYRPTYFIQMVQQYGGVEAARRLLRQDGMSEGLTKLWEMGRLDLSVEAFVLQPAYAALFSDEERELARNRLAELGYTPGTAPVLSATPVPAPSMVERLSRAVANTQGSEALNLASGKAEEGSDSDETIPLEQWRKNIRTQKELSRQLVATYPDWLVQQLGKRVMLNPKRGQELKIYLDDTYFQRVRINDVKDAEFWFLNLPPRHVERLRRELVQPGTLGQKPSQTTIYPNNWRFNIASQSDIQLVQQIILDIARTSAEGSMADATEEPGPPGGSSFVVMHKSDHGEQRYGETYQFTPAASGDSRKLINALSAFEQGGPPVSLVIYRPGPHYAFTAWARVVDVERLPGPTPGEEIYLLTLDQQEFATPLSLKGNAAQLMQQIGWLKDGLQSAFNFRSIRIISNEDLHTIIAAADLPREQPMTIADAAFTVLSRAGGGPLHLREILARIQAENLARISGETPQLTLASILLRNERFTNLGRNSWVLAAATDDIEDGVTADDEIVEQPEPITRQPKLYADDAAHFWRMHFPREQWEIARRAGVIAIGWPPDAPNQSVKRFRQIASGDRVVVYVQGGVIGGIGVVIKAFDPDNPRATLAANLLGEEFSLALPVAWADAPAEPVDLLPALRHPLYSALYNRLKNPHTVMPLSREDYTSLLGLLQIDDAGQPRSESRLPGIWPQLRSYLALASAMGDTSHSAIDLVALASTLDPPPATPPDADDLVAELLQLRLIAPNSDGTSYQVRGYVAGEPRALLRLAALALLVPAEGTADQYMLPARTIVPRMRSGDSALFVARFAPELNEADAVLLAGWYAEAGLIEVADDLWQPAADALAPLTGDDPASQAANELLQTLLAEIDGTLQRDLPHVAHDAPLPLVADLHERLAELAHELLFDLSVVQRIYRSLLAGRHVVLSGPPGTGKTELARRLPELLWREPAQQFARLTLELDQPPVQHVIEQRHGYAPIVVTATEDWGVRDVVGGIGPRLDESGGSLRYAIEYGALTRTVLQHYKDSEGGRKLPTTLVRRDYQHEQGRRYRGAWLVIDEFTRAPIDAAFGSLLTTLSGGEQARLAVPTSTNEPREISLPADFRIIGTLNSFDRHFLNQISEAMKRRFDFIDVLPPPPKDAILEQGIAVMQALRRVAASGYSPIERTGNPPTYTWPGVVNVSPETVDGRVGYRWHAGSDAVTHTLHSFWRIFSAIRVFRQLGTAQMVAVYTNLFTGVLIGMEWSAALDSALADALADQLQVLNRDEQRVLDALLEHSGNHALFAGAVQAIVRSLPAGRRAAFSHALREHDLLLNGSSDIGIGDGATLNEAQLGRVFDANDLLALPKPGLFRRRLRDLIGERGL